ncbi:MAG: Gfo/Idh/MocA family oxidoreductase [Treponema sp.]|jgi:predicted dehydrogenase|nr:Gfo/Idh/MocA family oxidoreductase [Treponema sp.]
MIHVAIIGCGSISRLHIEGYLAFPERCVITALCDMAPEKGEDQKKKYGLEGAKVFASHVELLKTLKDGETCIDMVSICTPPFTHTEITVDCLKVGVNTLVEKPMAASLEECDAMLSAAKESGKMLACIAQNRFREPITALKKILDAGLIGRVLHAQVDSFWWRGFHYYDLWWRGKWKTEGGGCTLNHTVHHIDMLIWMMGLPEKVTAVLSNAVHTNAEVEDVSVAVLRYPQGTLVQITSSVLHHGEEQQLIFQGEKARVSAPWKVHASLAGSNAFPLPEHDTELEKRLHDFVAALPPMQHTGHTGEIEDVLYALENGRPPAIGGQDGRNTIELISAIYKAGATETTVSLPLCKDDPFYTVKGILAQVPHFYEKAASVQSFEGDITTGGSYK